jgi:hypothetical protein
MLGTCDSPGEEPRERDARVLSARGKIRLIVYRYAAVAVTAQIARVTIRTSVELSVSLHIPAHPSDGDRST